MTADIDWGVVLLAGLTALAVSLILQWLMFRWETRRRGKR